MSDFTQKGRAVFWVQECHDLTGSLKKIPLLQHEGQAVGNQGVNRLVKRLQQTRRDGWRPRVVALVVVWDGRVLDLSPNWS